MADDVVAIPPEQRRSRGTWPARWTWRRAR